MAKCCACQRKGFYQYGTFFVLLLILFASYLVFTCPYNQICDWAHYICWTTLICGIGLSVLMCSVGMAYSKVATLTMTDLNSKMTISTQRWGWIAKAFPMASRYMFTVTGVLALLGFAVAGTVCPSAKEILQGMKEKNYNVTCTGREHNPRMDFGIIFVLWLILAIIGCCSATDTTALPFLHSPMPAVGKDAKGSCAACCERVTSCCHPR
mmetsp:Transcript_31505/g.61877  ORF Transcript_31505/g.61877 Transcript_31505/m.61877 type:complete len:210 (+) Transcript_31505:114-743(+)